MTRSCRQLFSQNMGRNCSVITHLFVLIFLTYSANVLPKNGLNPTPIRVLASISPTMEGLAEGISANGEVEASICVRPLSNFLQESNRQPQTCTSQQLTCPPAHVEDALTENFIDDGEICFENRSWSTTKCLPRIEASSIDSVSVSLPKNAEPHSGTHPINYIA